MRTFLVVLLLGLLGGCATTQPPVVITKVETQKVEVPVPVPCMSPKDVPEEPQWAFEQFLLAPTQGTLFQAIQAARAERLQRREFLEQVRILFQKCSGPALEKP